jgi:hypothetical protein
MPPVGDSGLHSRYNTWSFLLVSLTLIFKRFYLAFLVDWVAVQAMVGGIVTCFVVMG